jgi:PAS domain S-box-containing protein
MNREKPQKIMFSRAERLLVLKYFFFYLSFFVIFVAIVTTLLTGNEIALQRHYYSLHENREIDLPAGAMAGRLQALITDLLIISEKNEIQNMNDSRDLKYREALGREFFTQMKRNRIFKEICLVDPRGYELVKVVFRNDEPVLVTPEQLTLRNDPATLSILKKLNGSTLSFSPFEPERNERGEIGFQNSSLNLGKLIYDRTGRKQAVLLIQYYTTHVLDEFTHLSSNAIGDVFLLNEKGRLITCVGDEGLKTPTPEDSGMFLSDFGEEWKKISAEDSGQFINSKGIFTFRTIYPLLGMNRFQSSISKNDKLEIEKHDEKALYVKVVSVISHQRLLEPVTRFMKRLLILDFLVLIPLAALSWLFARTRTIRIKAEEALKESEARYSTVVENAKDGVIMLKNGTIVFVNRAMETITGYSNAELIHTQFLKILSPECHSVMDDVNSGDTCTDQTHPVYEARLRGKNECIRDVEISSDKVTVKGEEVTIAIVRDITDRKKAEENIKKMRDEFIYTLVHDMKGPLTSVNAYLKLISDPRFGEISDKKVGFIDIIKSSLDILLSMINNITNASRLDEGMMDYNFDDWRLEELLDELRKTFEALALISSVKLSFECSPSIWIHGDRDKIREVFHNLISNAFRYTPRDGEITITVKETDGRCEIRVNDTGYGIPETQLGNIFKKFTQVKGERRGTGLGLYIVKSIVEAHGSGISVESNVGKGTSFIFTLPRGTGVKQVEAPLQKVMLICDDEGATDLISGVMKKDGFPVIHEASGKAALQRISEERPALVVLYHKIADMDIVTFGREYRKNSQGNSAPVLLIASGFNSEWNELFSRMVPLPLNMAHFKETQRELMGIEVSIRSL